LLPEFLLPENTTLLYASSDVGREELIGNKALAECDRDARSSMAQIEAGKASVHNFETNMPKFCRRYAQVREECVNSLECIEELRHFACAKWKLTCAGQVPIRVDSFTSLNLHLTKLELSVYCLTCRVVGL
jgi:hypothetical protein